MMEERKILVKGEKLCQQNILKNARKNAMNERGELKQSCIHMCDASMAKTHATATATANEVVHTLAPWSLLKSMELHIFDSYAENSHLKLKIVIFFNISEKQTLNLRLIYTSNFRSRFHMRLVHLFLIQLFFLL